MEKKGNKNVYSSFFPWLGTFCKMRHYGYKILQALNEILKNSKNFTMSGRSKSLTHKRDDIHAHSTIRDDPH